MKLKLFIFLLFTISVIVNCTAAKKFGVVKIEPQAIGDMPAEAENVVDYLIDIMNVTDSLNQHDPKQTVADNDTLHVWWNYNLPDSNIDSVTLPFNKGEFIVVPNTDELWDVDGDANIYWKDWTYLDPGLWQAFITARNANGTARSNRYDFIVEGGSKPVKVIIRGL